MGDFSTRGHTHQQYRLNIWTQGRKAEVADRDCISIVLWCSAFKPAINPDRGKKPGAACSAIILLLVQVWPPEKAEPKNAVEISLCELLHVCKYCYRSNGALLSKELSEITVCVISAATLTHLLKQWPWTVRLRGNQIQVESTPFAELPCRRTTTQASVSSSLVSMVTAAVSSLSVLEIRVGLWLHPCAAYRIYISICCAPSTHTSRRMFAYMPYEYVWLFSCWLSTDERFVFIIADCYAELRCRRVSSRSQNYHYQENTADMKNIFIWSEKPDG